MSWIPKIELTPGFTKDWLEDTLVDESRVEVKPLTADFWPRNNYGLFANRSYEKGELILSLKGMIVASPTRTSIQMNENSHIENFMAGKLNHHCDPTTEIEFNKSDESNINLLVYALKDIPSGEQLTFDYETTESLMSDPFKCACHGKWIRGKDYEANLMIDEGGMDYSGAFESVIDD